MAQEEKVGSQPIRQDHYAVYAPTASFMQSLASSALQQRAAPAGEAYAQLTRLT